MDPLEVLLTFQSEHWEDYLVEDETHVEKPTKQQKASGTLGSSNYAKIDVKRELVSEIEEYHIIMKLLITVQY